MKKQKHEGRERGRDMDSEEAPLIALPVPPDGAPGEQARPRRPGHGRAPSIISIAASVHLPKAYTTTTIVSLLCAVVFVTSSAAGFATIPLVRLVEDVVCRQHYYDAQSRTLPLHLDDANEQPCKAEAVQSRVAFLFAISSTLEAVAGFLAAFPWGIAADRLGRKPVFAIALGGVGLGLVWQVLVLWFDALPIELVWLGALCQLLGGGTAVLIGVLMSILTDITTEQNRAVCFMRIHVASLVGSLVSPSLASAMMVQTGPWPTLMVALACVGTGAVAMLFVPETLTHKDLDPYDAPDLGQPSTPGPTLASHLRQTFTQLKESASIVRSPSLILLLHTSLVAMPLAASTTQFLVLFVSKRYAVPLSYTGYVQTVYGLAQIVQATLILPYLSRLFIHPAAPASVRFPSEPARDLALARWSFALLVAGCLCLGCAPRLAAFLAGLLVLALGSAFNSLCRALMSLHVRPGQTSRLFSLVGMVEVVGGAYAGPLLAETFSVGMRWGGGWIGLPYYSLGAICAAVFVLMTMVRVPKRVELAVGGEG